MLLFLRSCVSPFSVTREVYEWQLTTILLNSNIRARKWTCMQHEQFSFPDYELSPERRKPATTHLETHSNRVARPAVRR